MKKTFSFLAIILVSLFGIFGNYNLENYNSKNSEISANQQELVSNDENDDAYLLKGQSVTFDVYNGINEFWFEEIITFNDYKISNGQVEYDFTIVFNVQYSHYYDVLPYVYVTNESHQFLYRYDERNYADGLGVGETLTLNFKFTDSIDSRITINASEIRFFTDIPYVYPIIGETSPTINSFSVNESQTTSNSTSVNWNISDEANQITNIEIYDKDNNLKLSQYDKTNLIANDVEISNLDSNKNYNLELRIYWKDNVSGFENVMKQDASAITKAVEPNLTEFSLYQINKNNAILSIKYDDPDNVVDKITIHDKNANMKDVVLSPKDLDNGKYKLNKLSSGDYDLEITLHWTSLVEENSSTSNQNVEFTFKKSMSVALISTISIISLLILLLLLILLILYLIKRSKNKQVNEDNYYVEGENYNYEEGNNFYYENSQY